MAAPHSTDEPDRKPKAGADVPGAASPGDFERLAREEGRQFLLREFWQFLKENGKWWLAPMLLVLLALAVLMVLSTTGAAPWLYTFW